MNTNGTGNGRITLPLPKGFGRPAAYSLLETLAAYPLTVLLAHYALRLPDLPLFLALLALHAFAGLIGLRQAEGRLAGWPTLLPFAAALLLALLLPENWFARGACAAALLLASLRGLLTGRRQLWDNMRMRIPLTGLAAMLVLYIIAGRVPDLSAYRPLLYMAAVVLLALTLLLVNGDRVRNAAGQETASLPGVLAINRRLTWIVAGIVVAAGMIGGPTNVLGAIREWWLSIFSNTGGQVVPGAESPGMPAVDYSEIQRLGENQGETPLWLKAIGYALQGLFWMVMGLLAGWLLYRLLGKWIPNGMRNLIRKIAAKFGLMREIRAAQNGAGYTDKEEKLAAGQAGANKRRFRRFRREAEYAGDDPRLRYRSVVLHAARKGFPFLPSRTPSENGRELSKGGYADLSAAELQELVERYNESRYGGREKKN